ncbi:hypothetical protein DM860_013017 [Cuscuta australis]|uniref:Ubiquitin-like domain-containing protein n=1 Tax=Cuscuta australis TaxID=267555 RepID=A0A328D2Y3_9ASTE|nr:hypothetical protein DM860_013017 [Cuscuta australis]
MSHKQHGIGNEKVANHRGGDDDASSIVELSLGLGVIGSSSSSPPSSPPFWHQQQVKKKKKNEEEEVGLELRLGLLGLLRCEKNGKGVVEAEAPPARNSGGAFMNWACSSGGRHPFTFHDHHLSMPKSPSLSWSSLPHFHHCLQGPHQPPPGLWLTLRPSFNRGGVVFPQIAKAYIRVKDENVTVLVVKSYLVAKLGLSNQNQHDKATIRGHFLTTSNVIAHIYLLNKWSLNVVHGILRL